MKFNHSSPYQNVVCNSSCATSFNHPIIYGVGIRFDKPWEDGQDQYRVETVETSQGAIYLKFRLSNDASTNSSKYILENIPQTPLDDKISIEHYSCNEVNSYSVYCRAQVGMCLFIDKSGTAQAGLDRVNRKQDSEVYRETYSRQIEAYKTARKKIEDAIGKDLLYKSEPFWNSMHSERSYPSCTLYIFDKGMKHDSI